MFSSKETSAERRRHARYICSHHTMVRFSDLAGATQSIPGEIKNISISGVLFAPEHKLSRPPADYLDYQLVLDGASLPVQIVRTSFNGMHCTFESFLSEDELRDFLRDYGVRRTESETGT